MIVTRNFVVPANGTIPIIARGNFVRCLESDLPVFLNTTPIVGNGSTFEIQAGLSFNTREFEQLRIENKNASDLVVKLVISDEGQVTDDRLSAKATLSFNASGGTYAVKSKLSFTGVQTKVLCVTDTLRKNLTYQIDAPCYLGDATNGMLLPAGIYQWDNVSGVDLVSTVDSTCRILEEYI